LAETKIRGEMIKYDGSTGKIDAYLAGPAGNEKHPGIVLIHEIFGLNDHIKDVADRIAKEGYVVLAPHLFSSKHVPQTMTPQNIELTMQFMMSLPPERQRDLAYVQEQLAKYDETKRGAIQSLMGILFNLPRQKLAEELSAGVDYLNSLPNIHSGKIGCAGFCFGGAMSAELGCTGKTAATVIFYGQNPEPLERVKNINGPVLGLYGAIDKRINEHLHELVRAFVEYDKVFEIVVYSGAAHAFFNNTGRNYNEEAAKDAWERLMRFFSVNLRQGV
jgi:carboxymethylenebutenolidase